MWRYVLRRLMFGAVTGLLVSLFIFAILRIAPGDVALMIAEEQGGEFGEVNLSQELIDDIREELGLDAPLPVQYLTWLGGIVTLDWGTSLYVNRSVWAEFKKKAPVTVELALMTVILATLLGIPVGIIMALKQDTATDYGLRIFSLAGLSMPNFWIATMVIMLGIYVLDWSPRVGYVHIWDDPKRNLLMFLPPALILGYASMATKSRMMRSTMLEVLRQDYIRTAHAKGLRHRIVVYRHAMKNALLPVVTIIGIQISHIIGGSVIMERIFNMPGIGNFLVEGMNQRDYPVVQSLILIFAMWVVLTNLMTDLAYGWLDPRIRYD